jgi:ppGpp synthetase/RelA/SpoT-type nucleotidyltranferase
MPLDPRTLYEEYAPQVEPYERLSGYIARIMESSAQEAGLFPAITARPKDMRSLIKKCMFHGGPVSKVRDRAGVKVVARYTKEIVQLRGIIKQKFDCVSGPDIKQRSYKPGQLGYLGTHFHVRLKAEQLTGYEDLVGLECEIILHTGAETLWDSISHQLLYKPFVQLSPKAQRILMRLLALVELFDKEVASVRSEYTSKAGYETARMLDVLEKYFYRLDPRDYQRDLSVKIIDALAPKITKERKQRFEKEIEEFVIANRKALINAYNQYKEPGDYQGVFLHQPESLLIFAMFSWFQNDEVKEAWLPLYSRSSLEELAKIWGANITDH